MSLLTIVREKCPKCKGSNIFSVRGNLLLFQIPKIKDTCEKCNFKFEREPGFFFGAMFVSYAIAVVQSVLVFVLSYVVIGLNPLYSFFAVVVSAILFSTYNFRLSRIIWIHLFSNTTY
ncbi:DUF983 domain-containing protein [Psychroserpens burtonensis]|uniref:DUF983 domain-containing protein n=1 Tax=Psychroserpens burtonensis TaxID=49278 RepID=A0A5C7BAY5_9FLAO|nr:DUF983 domain-containing protein [Psychroserpens burtonensis]TXE19722.1 DUF983 domain-containing protein [Psychroserpens burtonensis]